MEFETILFEKADQIGRITLNQPKTLNALNLQLASDLREVMSHIKDDSDLRVLVLTGTGRGFCAGADLKGLSDISQGGEMESADTSSLDADPGDPTMGASFRGTYSYPMSIPKPVIAAINGPCAGMAVPIAAYCDIRFAGESASFTTAFSKRGLIAEWGISWILTRLIGPAHALDLLFSSRKIDAAEAERMGLVNRVLPDAELMPFVQDYAREMAANCSPRSIAVMKREVYQHMMESLEHAQRDSVRLMFESFKAPDFKEGVKSFLEKRPPKFDRLG